MQITRIRRHPRRERARIYVDGEERPRTELALDLVLQEGLAVGDDLGAARLEELERRDETYRARDAALTLLSHRARSRVELRRRLARRGFDGAVIDGTLGWLEEKGYVDDRAFAESFVRDRLRLRPRGRVGLVQELRRKGVDPAIAEAAAAAGMEAAGVSEAGLARSAAEAWARKNASAVRRAAGGREHRLKARRRLYGHLARRGFAPDAVRSAIDAVFDD